MFCTCCAARAIGLEIVYGSPPVTPQRTLCEASCVQSVFRVALRLPVTVGPFRDVDCRSQSWHRRWLGLFSSDFALRNRIPTEIGSVFPENRFWEREAEFATEPVPSRSVLAERRDEKTGFNHKARSNRVLCGSPRRRLHASLAE